MTRNKQRLWSGAILCVIIFLAFGSSDTRSSGSSSSSTPSKYDLGYEGVIDIGGGLILIARTEEAFGELTNLMLAKDKEGILKMMLEGKVFSVENGTKARVIGLNWTGGIRVRILSGEHYGDDGWIPVEFLK